MSSHILKRGVIRPWIVHLNEIGWIEIKKIALCIAYFAITDVEADVHVS